MIDPDKQFMNRAMELALQGMQNNLGGPFECVIIRKNKIAVEGNFDTPER